MKTTGNILSKLKKQKIEKEKTLASTKSDKSRNRKWSEKEIDQLIDMLGERVCLWDVFNSDYHNRDKKERALKEIEESIGIKVAKINKITGLRAQLGRELSKSSYTKSGLSRGECVQDFIPTRDTVSPQNQEFVFAINRKSVELIKPSSAIEF